MWKAELGLHWHECEIVRQNPKSVVVRFLKVVGKDGKDIVIKRKPYQIKEYPVGG